MQTESEVQAAAASQRRQARATASAMPVQLAPTFTMEDAARDAMPGHSDQMLEFLRASGKIVGGNFHNM